MMAHKTTIDQSESLELHVLGAGKGESIILRCPGGGWGVIDCYALSLDDLASNPTLQFLKERGVSVLEFLCLTHPHDDHFRGMSQLLEQLEVKHFWRFAGLAGRDLQRLALLLSVDAIQQLTTKDPEFGKYDALMLQNRNQNWIPVMATEMKKAPTFFAVGAAHLGGINGVINLLRKRGYLVKPIIG